MDVALLKDQSNRDLAVTFHLTPSLANLLGLLLSVNVLNEIMVRTKLGTTTDPKVTIWRLRRDLTKWAAKNSQPQIDIKSKRTLGYWLEPDDKLRIKKLIDAVMGGSDGARITAEEATSAA